MIRQAANDSETSVGKPSRVLIIDSDDVDRRVVHRMLGDRFEVLEAGNGEDGLALFETLSPQCVLLDHALPDANGTRTFDELVKQGATVILLTNDSDADHALEAVRRGAQDYLDKNFLNSVMLERVIRYAVERTRLNREIYRSLEDLKESEQRFSELASRIHHGLWIWSMGSEASTYQNAACDRIFGRTLEELNNMEWYEIIHPDDQQAEIELSEQCKKHKKEYESHLRIVQPDGEIRHVEQACFPILNESGDVVRVIGICRDVTERVKLEEELRLAHKLEAVGQLAAGVAHEINTPSQYVSDNCSFLSDSFDDLMPVLQGYNELLAWAKTSGMEEADFNRLSELTEKADLDYLLDEMPVALQQSRDGLEQIKKIVRAMKDFSHPGDDMEAVDINAAIESTTTVARNEWKYVADMQLDLCAELPNVICVPSAINQVILNMIVNGAHAIDDVVKDKGGEKGQIRISTSVSGDQAQIEIADTGCGMPKEVSDRIFDPFFTTKEVGKGTGQGLAIVHAVVTERHNGCISVDSTPGEGTTFTIQLPIDGQGAQPEGQAA